MDFAFLRDAFFQVYFIPAPTLTEANLPDQRGRVLMVTGGYAGVGKELSRILYARHGAVYIAGRSQAKFDAAAAEIRAAHPSSDGRLEFLPLDFADLPTVKAAADTFLRREQRLDVLTNNAGIMTPPVGTQTAQGHEAQLGTNVLGPWLLTALLTPLLARTAAGSAAGSVRVTWASSLAHLGCPVDGVAFADDGAGGDGPMAHGHRYTDYAQSKAANILLAREYQARHGDRAGIVSASFHPGALRSELQRHLAWYENLLGELFYYPPVYGAYTELYAGWAEEVARPEHRGKNVVPWSRFGMVARTIEEGAAGPKLWEWCERQTRAYM